MMQSKVERDLSFNFLYLTGTLCLLKLLQLSFENDSLLLKHSLVCLGSVLFCTKLPVSEYLYVNSNCLIDKHFPVLIFQLVLALL